MFAYVIKGELGRGGYAIVYRATHARLGRDVALKMLHRAAATAEHSPARIRREIEVLTRLRHPHIIKVLDYGSTEGQWYYAMELLDARPLDQLIKQAGPVAPERAVALIVQAADALSFCHEQGLIHRDVKPGNIMVDARDHLTLMDFGLVRPAEGTLLTADGELVGTLRYLAPEIIRGLSPTAASDVYALGVTLYELLAGRQAFEPLTPDHLLGLILSAGPRPILEHVPTLPPALVDLVGRLMAKEPARRPVIPRVLEELRLLACRPGMDRSSVGHPPAPVAAARVQAPDSQPGPPRATSWAVPTRHLTWARAGLTAVLLVGLGAVAVRLSSPTALRPPAPTVATASASPVPALSAAQREEVAAAIWRIADRAPSWARLPAMVGLTPSTDTLAQVAAAARALVAGERSDRAVLVVAAARLGRAHGGPPAAPAADLWTWALTCGHAYSAYTRIERYRQLAQRLDEGRQGIHNPLGTGFDIFGRLDRDLYGSEGLADLRCYVTALLEVLARVAADPASPWPELGAVLAHVREVGGTFVYADFRPPQAREAARLRKGLDEALDRLERPLGPVLSRLTRRLLDWGEHGGATQKARASLGLALEELETLARLAPGAAAGLEPLVRRIQRERPTRPTASPRD